MYSVIISVVSFTLIIFCGLYIIKEMIRRKKRSKKFLETNNDIRGSIIFWSIGVIATIGYTIAYYTIWFQNNGFINYLFLCLICLVFVFVAFILAIKKIIINTETGDIIACSLFGIKRCNVRDITLVKHTWDASIVYSGKRKLFVLRERCNDEPIGFYVYIIKNSNCKEIRFKGFFVRK